MKSDALFFFLFTALCVAFVPVLFFYGINDITVPVSAVLFDAGWRQWHTGRSGMLPFGWICVGLYVTWFMIVGSLALRVARKMTTPLGRLRFQLVMLGLACAMSFVPMISYSIGGSRSTTYFFWTAVWRYFERWA